MPTIEQDPGIMFYFRLDRERLAFPISFYGEGELVWHKLPFSVTVVPFIS
jgi:hypothetical protein